MIRDSVIVAWFSAVLVFFGASILSDVLTGTAHTTLAIVVCGYYVCVLAYTLAPPPRPKEQSPSVVRSRVEAARRRRQA